MTTARSWGAVALIAVGLPILSACGTEVRMNEAAPREGMALPELLIGSGTDSFLGVLTGTLGMNDEGCITIDDAIAVAPPGSEMTSAGEVRIPGYEAMKVGEDVKLGGGLEDSGVDSLTPEQRRCVAEGEETVLFAAIAANN